MCQALCHLVVIGLRYLEYELLTTEEQNMMLGSIIFGTGAIASFAAIENIVVEHAFGGTFFSAFLPAKKFWSAKVLVPFSFM